MPVVWGAQVLLHTFAKESGCELSSLPACSLYSHTYDTQVKPGSVSLRIFNSKVDEYNSEKQIGEGF